MLKHDEEYYRLRKPKPDLGAVNNFKRFIWDPKRRAFLDITAQEWANIGLFYLCFYGVLFSFTGLQMWLTYKYVTVYDKPFFQYSRLASQKAWLEPSRVFRMAPLNVHGPGIVFKPNIVENSDPPLILIDESNELGQLQNYVHAIKETLSEYKVDESKFDAKCSDKILRDGNTNKSCYFDIKALGPCAHSPYGYEISKPRPCVYIKFNKRYGWLPIYYSQATVLPDDMPKWLQNVIQNSNKFHVWLSCEGKNEDDAKFAGEIEYLPLPGFPVQFFPYSGQSDYLSPIVALRFKNLTADQLVNIECKTWARNIDNENRYNLNFRMLIKNRSG